MQTNDSDTRLLTINQFCAQHKWARLGGIRSVLFHRHSNGLEASGAVVRFGRKILLDEDRFVSWMRKHGGRRVQAVNDTVELAEALRELEQAGLAPDKAAAILASFARGLRAGLEVGPEVAREKLRNHAEGAPLTAATAKVN